VQDAEARIKCLVTKLEDIAKKGNRTSLAFLLADQALQHNESNDVVQQSFEETRVRMETKLELWRIFLQDATRTME
jgi:hypothetical protein